jgi:PAS domain S-box-containing protein
MGYSWLSIAVVALIVFQSLLISLLLIEQYRRRRATKALDERLRFETLLSDLSADFTQQHSDEVDPKIKKWLNRLVEFLGVDRGTLIQLLDGDNTIHRIHSYDNREIRPASELITAKQLPWYVDQLRQGVTLSHPRVSEELPEKAVAEREYIDRAGIKSFLGIPVSVGESVIFALSFATIKSYRSWPADLIVRLRMVGEIFAQAMVRKQVDAALRLSEERYRSVVEGQTELICRYLPDTTLTFVNDAYCRYFSKSREELIGTKFLQLIPEAAHEKVNKQIESLFEKTPVEAHEHEVLLPGGGWGWQHWVNHAIFDEEGSIIEFQAVGRDITERRRAEEELRRLTARLLRLQDEERHRIASELHDSLGQSLAIIRNRATICLRSSADQEQVKEQLEEISATAAAAIDDVREIMHNLRPYELDRLGLVEAIESMTIKVSNSTAIRLRCELDRIEGLFTPEEETWIYRIVQEGLNNVVRHAEATEGRVVIRREGSEVIISVEDNGRGIEARAGEWNGKEAGGLGLAGIAERARMLGGTHEMRSEPGCGTTLTVRLDVRSSGN